MSIEIKIVAINPGTKHSLIFVDGKPYKPQDLQKGLCKLIEVMFDEIFFEQDSRPNCIITHSQLSDEKPKTIMDLVLTDLFYYNDQYGNHVGNDLPANVLESVLKVVGLITWLKSPHFKKNELMGSQTCVLCGNIQHGKVIGRANLSLTDIIHWTHVV